MTYVFNDPTKFADELTEGFVAAYADWVMQVSGGVVRSTAVPTGQVAVVIGGGSGHYPAFAGLVGPGLAHGAAMGNIFASPSAHHVHNVANAAHSGGGILLTYGNYAGDVLNFDQAQEQLRREGINCETVVVTDDIASAPPNERNKRRGIAGDLFVFKTAAAAAEAGRSLSEVAAIARRANDVTRTLGVAFTGCTLPGATEPLFTVPAGRMGVGMGIHGEPGIAEEDIPSADELAALLVERVLAERPAASGSRITVLLNGLGSVKYEELFVLYRTVARILTDRGHTIVQPEIGELVTSFQMAGVSLTISWLDDELEELWSAPANTPAYRKGNRGLGKHRSTIKADSKESTAVVPGSAASQTAAQTVRAALAVISATVDKHCDELGALDAIAGDGDHGIGMQRGAHAAVAAANASTLVAAGAQSVLTTAADAWAENAGGTSGALWGCFLREIATGLGNETAPTAAALVQGVNAGVQAVRDFGKATVGDKTMVDALIPLATTFERAIDGGDSVTTALQTAADAAIAAAAQTADLVPKLGRARPHAEKSLGSPDPGATSLALIAQALAQWATATD